MKYTMSMTIIEFMIRVSKITPTIHSSPFSPRNAPFYLSNSFLQTIPTTFFPHALPALSKRVYPTLPGDSETPVFNSGSHRHFGNADSKLGIQNGVVAA